MPMHKQQPLQEAELRDGVVGRVHRLSTFFTRDTDTDVGGLNHGDVVGTVADGETHDAEAILDEVDDLRLLLGGYTTADDALAKNGEAQKRSAVLVVVEGL